jgi:hypothetical protein
MCPNIKVTSIIRRIYMPTHKLPRAKFFSNPFVSGYSDIDKENSNLFIGASEKPDDIRFGSNDLPEYIFCICNLIPKSEFNPVNVCSRYKENQDSSEESLMEFNIYSGEHINMKGFVSEIAVECTDIFQSASYDCIPKHWVDFIQENKIIYNKKFMLQPIDFEIESFFNENLEVTDISHYKSKAHFFAGSYYKGIAISDIQQYMFFLRANIYGEKFINIISSKEILNSNSIPPADEIRFENLSTLQDDISSGKIMLEFPDNVRYKSIDIKKETLTFDICKIIFKKSQSE